MKRGRKRLTAVTRIGHRLVPADTAHGVVGVPVGVIAELPSRGPGAAGRVDEQPHRVVERQRLSRIAEIQPLPIAAPFVASGVHELFVCPVRDLVPVNEKRRDFYGGKLAFHHRCARDCSRRWSSGHVHHVGWLGANGIQRALDVQPGDIPSPRVRCSPRLCDAEHLVDLRADPVCLSRRRQLHRLVSFLLDPPALRAPRRLDVHEWRAA